MRVIGVWNSICTCGENDGCHIIVILIIIIVIILLISIIIIIIIIIIHIIHFNIKETMLRLCVDCAVVG